MPGTARSSGLDNASARQRLLDAAADLHRELDLPALARGLHPGALARQAGVSRTSFYANWETNDEYWADLVDYVCRAALPYGADPERPLPDSSLIDLPTMRAATRHSFELGLARRELPLLMLLWSKAADRPVGEVLRRGYDAMLAPLVPRYHHWFASWGREPRPPLSMRDITTIFVALSDGLCVRHQFDPSAAPSSLFEDAMIALIPAVTRAIEDRDAGALDSQVASFMPDRIEVRLDRPPVTRRRASTRAAILDAFDRLVNDRGIRGVTIADVAARARMSPSTVYEHFGSKATLAVEVAALYAVRVARQVEALPPGTPIEDCLVVIYDHLAEHYHVYDGAHAARLEDPMIVPAPDMRNPVVAALTARVAAHNPASGAPGVIAAVWWRSLLTAVLLGDIAATGAELARVLVLGLGPAGGTAPPRATLHE